MNLSYEESFQILSARVEIFGDPSPTVVHAPRHDADKPGPSIFRMMVDEAALENLTIPGLFVGHSELGRVSFRGSDLHLSTLNWNDFVECDFSKSDLTQCDLRSSHFVRCTFDGADLSGADLRTATFEGCSFQDTLLQGSVLYKKPRMLGLFKTGSDQASLPLSKSQRSAINWSGNANEPEGG
jgi:hypothetical protein